MAANEAKEAAKKPNIPSIIILDSEDEEEQTTDELFEGFIKAVQPFLDRKELLLLRVKFQAVGHDFKGSSGFKDMLRRKINQVRQVDVYIHFNEVLNAVIRNAAVYGAIGSKRAPNNCDQSDENTSGCQKGLLGAETRHNENLAGNFENADEDRPRKKIALNQSNELKDSEVEVIEDASLSQSSSSSRDFQSSKNSDPKTNDSEKEKMKMKRKKRIAKLESKLKYISEEIKRLSQAELSLEEMQYGDSSYIMENRLKKRFNSVWNKICKLKGRPPNTGRVVEGSVACKKTGFPAIDKAISKFLKKRQGFPDIFDIRNIIIRVNKKYSLGLTQVVQNDIAVDVLTDVGNKLQKKRKKDFEYNFGCHLTDDCLPSLDPALNSTELRQKLEDNKRVNQTALEKVFEKYVHLGRVKGGHVSKCSDVTSESDSEREEESDKSRRKLKRNRKSSSGSESEDESSRRKHRKQASTDDSKRKAAFVNANDLAVKSAVSKPMNEKDKILPLDVENSTCNDENTTDQSRRNNEMFSLEVENSVGKDDKTTDESGRKLKRDRKSSSSSESEGKSSRMKHKKDRTAAHDNKRRSVDANGIAVKGATSSSVHEKDKICILDVENSECNNEKTTANDSMQNSLVDSSEMADKTVTLVSTPQYEELPSLENRGSAENGDVVMKETDLKKQKTLFNSTKLNSKIQELRENKLGKFIQNRSSIKSSASENQGGDFCHSKRKSASVRHITQNQQLRSTASNNSVDNEAHNHTSDFKKMDDGKMQTADNVSKTSEQSVRITEDPNSGISSPQSKKEVSNRKESSMTIRNNVLHNGKATGLSVRSCLSSSEHSGHKGRLSSTSTPNGKLKLQKNVETVVIILDDDDD